MDNEITKRLNIIKQFDKLFKKKDILLEDDTITKKDYIGYMDNANIMMVIPKTRTLKTELINSFDVTESDRIPDLDYTNVMSKSGLESASKFSCEYLGILLSLCKHSGTMKLYVKADYPLKVETDDIIVVLAPRVED